MPVSPGQTLIQQAPDEPFEGAMSKEAWDAIPPAKKLQMIPTFHQGIVHNEKMTEFVRAALVQSIMALVQKGGNPTQALVIVAQTDDPVFAAMPEDVRTRFTKTITDPLTGEVLRYIVFPWERDLWTGGPGAPDWAEKHPYKPQMLMLCEEPEAGCLWIVIYAGGACSVFQLGDKPLDAPKVDVGGTVVDVVSEPVDAEPAYTQGINPFDPPDSSDLPTG